MIVVDEAHRMSNASSTQGANLKKLNAKYKLSMTGSLITNNPESCYLPLSWTENDSSTLTNFKSQYCTYGGFGGKQVIGYKNLDLLKEELESCSLRRTFDQVKGNMPKKTVEFETVELSDDHLKLYDAVVNGVKEEVDKVELSTGNLLALTTRLRQATTAPGILTTENINNEKLNRAVEIIEDILSQNGISQTDADIKMKVSGDEISVESVTVKINQKYFSRVEEIKKLIKDKLGIIADVKVEK